MQVIPPVIITEAKLTSSTVPEQVAATYNAGTTYDEGDLTGVAPTYGSPQTVWRSKAALNLGNTLEDGVWFEDAGIVYPEHDTGQFCNTGGIVTYLATHSLYRSKIDSNNTALSNTDNWEYIGRTNRYRMFDYERNQRTSAPLEVTVVFAPGKRVNSISLNGMVANAYSISGSSVAGGGVVFTKSGSLSTRETLTFTDYCFGEFDTIPALVFFDVPPYSDLIFTVTLTATSGNAEISSVAVGTFVYIGIVETSASSDALNFSTVDRDVDGNATLTRRRSVPKNRLRIRCAKANVNKVRKTRELLNGVPAVWHGITDPTDGYFEMLTMVGIHKGFEIDGDLPDYALVNLQLEEV